MYAYGRAFPSTYGGWTCITNLGFGDDPRLLIGGPLLGTQSIATRRFGIAHRVRHLLGGHRKGIGVARRDERHPDSSWSIRPSHGSYKKFNKPRTVWRKAIVRLWIYLAGVMIAVAYLAVAFTADEIAEAAAWPYAVILVIVGLADIMRSIHHG